VIHRGRTRRSVSEQLSGGPRRERRLVAGGGADRRVDLLGLGVLQQVAERAGVEHLHDPLPIGERREHDNPRVRSPGQHTLGNLDAVQVRHGKGR
jgi:hypothetical protein